MQQLIAPAPGPIDAIIDLPGSKSMTNRALLLAALAKGVSEISGVLLSDDTEACIEALHALGIAISVNSSIRSCIIAGCEGIFPHQEATIQCRDAGTVARFLLAACAGTPGTFTFTGSAQLSQRPLQPLITALTTLGASFTPQTATHLPLTLKGADILRGGTLDIEGKTSSQFLSALLMISPFTQTPLTLETHTLVSRPFVHMTCAMMADFGVLVRQLTPNRYFVPVPQRYQARDYLIEPDFSLAANFFAAAAVTQGTMQIQPVDITKSKQGDIQFLLILRKMGCRIIEGKDGLTVQGPTELHGVNVDMRDYSDTFMALAAIAPFATTPTTITNIGHTRSQESNRIQVMCSELKKLNIQVEEGCDWLRIHPSQPIQGAIDAHGDHRIAMAFAIIGLRTGIIIHGAECVKKTCPDFFKLWGKLYDQKTK